MVLLIKQISILFVLILRSDFLYCINSDILFKTHSDYLDYGTDYGLYNKGVFEGDIFLNAKEKVAVRDTNKLWSYGVIPYKLDEEIGCPYSTQCKILMKAIDHYHKNSCVRFKEWTGEKDYVDIFLNSNNDACWSFVGRSGNGGQKLSLGERCWYFGIVVHELGHALGFWHEMNRPDRDDYIHIYRNNIIPGFESAFRIHDVQTVDTLGESFDYKSIMMYDEYAFSKDGKSPTLQSKDPKIVIGPIWKKNGLSTSDIRRVNKLYQCKGTLPKTGFPFDIKCNFNKNVCGFKNGGFAVWNWYNANDTDGYMYSSFEISDTTPGYFISVNFHPVSSGSSSSQMGCIRFWYMLESTGNACLKLSQVYLNSVTDESYDSDMVFDLWENSTVTDKWLHVEMPLYISRPFKLIFMASFDKSSTSGTITLDDVELYYTSCSFPVTASPLRTSTVLKPTTFKSINSSINSVSVSTLSSMDLATKFQPVSTEEYASFTCNSEVLHSSVKPAFWFQVRPVTPMKPL